LLIEVASRQLYQALQVVAKAVPAKSPIPVLTGICLKATASGLTLQACNGDMMLQYRIAEHTEHLIIREGGQIVVPAQYFIDIIRNSSLEELVSLALTDDGVICIKTGSAVYRLCGMPADEFPQIAEMQQPDLAGIPNDKLRALIGQVAFAVSGSQTRPVLTGVRCHFSGEGLRLLATDGIRLASRTMPVNAELQPDRSAVVVQI
jgi:DNA polymerase III subunit beta